MKHSLNAQAIQRIGHSLQRAYPAFDVERFCKQANAAVDGLELKQRVDVIIAALHEYLPSNFEETAPVLLGLKPLWDRGDLADNFRGFAAWPVIDYVAVHGIDYPHLALPILKELSELFTAEFAIRHFFIQHYELTYKTTLSWLQDEDYHSRRLASEGSRPRLPWGLRLQRFVQDPEPLRLILTALKDDPENYVYRSVANNLNDISKDHPEWVIALCQQWQDEGASKNCLWVIKHATRSLVKAGYPDVFALLGYSKNPKVEATGLTLSQQSMRIGEDLQFSFSIEAKSKSKFVLDYVVHYQKANGSLSPKVYKLKVLELSAGESLSIKKKQAFKPISTRKFHVGEHRLAIVVNGKELASIGFELKQVNADKLF